MEKKLNFTDQALNQINLITKGNEKKYFRITVQGGGCSGFKYSFGFDSKSNKDISLLISIPSNLISLTVLPNRESRWPPVTINSKLPSLFTSETDTP